MHSINLISSRYSFPHYEHNSAESEFKNINFANITKLNILGAYPKKRQSCHNNAANVSQVNSQGKEARNGNQISQLSFDLLDKAFEQLCRSSKGYLYENIEHEVQLMGRIEDKLSKPFLNRSHYQCPNKLLGLKRDHPIKEQIDVILYETNKKAINSNSNSPNNNNNNTQVNSNKLLQANQIAIAPNKEDDDLIQCATQNSSNNESSSLSNKYLHVIKKFLLKLGNKYQTVHHKSQKDILFSFCNSFYSITIERKTHKVSSFNKKELYKEEICLKNETEISSQLENIYKGLKYIRNKQKASLVKN